MLREEDEERKKLQLQEEQQKAAELSKSSEVEKLLSLIGSGMITPEMFQQYMTSTQLASTNTSAPANTIFQSIQQNLLNSSTASSSTSNIPTLDLTQYINNVSQYAKLTAAASAHQQQQASLNASKPSTNVNQPGHGSKYIDRYHLALLLLLLPPHTLRSSTYITFHHNNMNRVLIMLFYNMGF